MASSLWPVTLNGNWFFKATMVDKWGPALSLPPDLFVTLPKSSEPPRGINRAQGQPATWGLEGASPEGAFVLFATDLYPGICLTARRVSQESLPLLHDTGSGDSEGLLVQVTLKSQN